MAERSICRTICGKGNGKMSQMLRHDAGILYRGVSGIYMVPEYIGIKAPQGAKPQRVASHSLRVAF